MFATASPQTKAGNRTNTTNSQHNSKGMTIQTKLTVGQPGDKYEQEADAIADRVMRMPDPQSLQRKCADCEQEEKVQSKPLSAGITPYVQRQAKGGSQVGASLESRLNSSKSSGHTLPDTTRSFMESRIGADFSNVKIHTDSSAVQMSQELGAQAFTHGNHIYFNTGKYSPESPSGKHLLAHEMVHTMQQSQRIKPKIQRTLGDGHDLTSPRFSQLLDLEAAYDDESIIKKGDKGRGVQAIQIALYDLGFSLSDYGADGDFGDETVTAVEAFQTANSLTVDGEIGPNTMTALDARFGIPTLPSAVALAGPWTPTCVQQVLCPWSPHTINILATRITLKSFDSISWADEKWDGTNWVPAPFPGGGYNTGTEIGVLNSDCEGMSETLYHEVLHAEQPSTHRTTLEKESYAYRIGEEFSIAMGLKGISSLRSTDAQGREYADRTKVETFVESVYPSVPSGGGGDQIVRKAITYGHVIVERPNGTRYTRPASVGEKVPGPINLVNEVTHPTNSWNCP